MKKGPTNALESTFMGLGGPINCQRQEFNTQSPYRQGFLQILLLSFIRNDGALEGVIDIFYNFRGVQNFTKSLDFRL